MDNVNTTKKLVGLAALLLFVSLAGSYLAVGLGWLRKPAEIMDVDNVEKEYGWFHEHRRGLDAIRFNIQALDSDIDTLVKVNGDDELKWTHVTRQEYMQLVRLRTQQVTAYNSACASYQARWDNIFHSVVAPRDIPRDCPLVGGE